MGCLQLCVLLCLIAGLAALPICNYQDEEAQRICREFEKRWYDIQKEIQSKECPSVNKGDPDYADCLEKANKKTTEKLYSEFKDMPLSNSETTSRTGVIDIIPKRDENGELIKREHQNEETFLQSIWNALKFW